LQRGECTTSRSRPAFLPSWVGFFLIVLTLRSVRYAYESLGVSSNTAIFLLFATLIGSIFNIPIAELSPERAVSHHVVNFFGTFDPQQIWALHPKRLASPSRHLSDPRKRDITECDSWAEFALYSAARDKHS
jgi:hypothetical protein